jgi:hypothetical protein
MFKRVEKRRRKKDEEDKLGLGDDMKEILGLQDTDSDESESDSDSDSYQGIVREEEEVEESNETKGSVEQSVSEDSDWEDVEETPISVLEALRDPIYIVSIHTDIKACIVCPGKLLKNPQMTASHTKSKASPSFPLSNTQFLTTHNIMQAHTRRFKHFTELAGRAKPGDNAREFIPKGKSPEHPTASRTSKREAKRVRHILLWGYRQ